MFASFSIYTLLTLTTDKTIQSENTDSIKALV